MILNEYCQGKVEWSSGDVPSARGKQCSRRCHFHSHSRKDFYAQICLCPQARGNGRQYLLVTKLDSISHNRSILVATTLDM